MFKAVRRGVGVALAVVLAVTVLPAAASAAPSASTDASCTTRPSTVSSSYDCRTLHELAPSNNTATSYGEVWYVRTGGTLSLRIFTTLALSGSDPVQVCVAGAAFPVRKNGNPFRCVGGEDSRVYVGSSTSPDINISSFPSTYFFQVHVNQGGRSTFTGGDDEDECEDDDDLSRFATTTNNDPDDDDDDDDGCYVEDDDEKKPGLSATIVCAGKSVTFVVYGFKPSTGVKVYRSIPGEETSTYSATTNQLGLALFSLPVPKAKSYELVAVGTPPGGGATKEVTSKVSGKDCTITITPVSDSSPLAAVKETSTSPGVWLIGLALLMMLVPPLRRRRRNHS